MSLKDKFNQAAHWTAALTAAATMQAGAIQQEPDNVNRNAPIESIERPTTEYLDYRVKRGAYINGETQQERQEKWQKMKEEKGLAATWDAIDKEKMDKIEIPRKDKDGYVIEKYDFETLRTTADSYYPNGVQRSKMGEHGEEAEGYYPDGSRKFSRTADGVETWYHPGGKKGEEKIKETPHGTYDAYDVLDEQGRRTEHHHDVGYTTWKSGDSLVSSRDVKTVDLYNPETKKLEGTYTLDDWNVEEGRLSHIGFVDETGKMKTMDFPANTKIGDTTYWVHSMSKNKIQKIYQEETKERGQRALEQAKLNKLKAER